MKTAIKTALVGIGATATVDAITYILSLFTHKGHGIIYIGRWVAYAFNGTFLHATIIETPSVTNEVLIGWLTHYVVGILFAFGLIALFGKKWLAKPGILAAMIVANVTLFFPICILQPAMGFGIAFSKLPQADFLLAKIMLIHAAYGFGLYYTALILNKIPVNQYK